MIDDTIATRYAQRYARLYIFEDNQAVIKSCFNRRFPTFNFAPRTDAINLARLHELLYQDGSIYLRYVNTKQQLGDIVTKMRFTTLQWRELCQHMHLGNWNVQAEEKAQQQVEENAEENTDEE